MAQLPRDPNFDSALAFLRDPYGFIARRCERYGMSMFETRLMLEKTICMKGAEAAALFYDEDRFIRKGAMPAAILKTLIGEGAIQTMDEAAHKHRKRMFMSLVTPAEVQGLVTIMERYWRSYAHQWSNREEIVLYDQVREMLTRAVCEWAGVPLSEDEVQKRTRELTALFQDAGAKGPKHFWSRLARQRAEKWAAAQIERIRANPAMALDTRAAQVIALHDDLNGELMSPRMAAVELLNVLRPTVAVAVYITFVAHALHTHPEARQQLATGDETYADYFVQEVRRFYPFFPAVAARVRQDFDYQGYTFTRGTRVMLDLNGTNHDPRTWQDPDIFRPERFATWEPDPFTLIPQGGGNPYTHHRCPGEGIAIALMKAAAFFLARDLTYDVPPQVIRIDDRRLPALPRSRFIITHVRLQRSRVEI